MSDPKITGYQRKLIPKLSSEFIHSRTSHEMTSLELIIDGIDTTRWHISEEVLSAEIKSDSEMENAWVVSLDLLKIAENQLVDGLEKLSIALNEIDNASYLKRKGLIKRGEL